MPLEASRSFRRCGPRDERRRRLLTDDLSGQDDRPVCRVWPDDAPPAGKSEHYGNAEFLEWQLRLLDLAPRRWTALGGLLAVGAAAVVGLEAAYAWMLGRATAGGAVVASLEIGAKGSLACWFSSLILLAAAAAAMLVYTVRKHRVDDYQGRYRVWLWAAGCWFLMATDQAASLREGFRDAMIALTGTVLMGDGALWWVAVYVLTLGAVGARLLRDMRSCRLSSGFLLAAAIVHGLAMADRLGWIMAEGGSRAIMFRAGSEMVGNLMLLAAMCLHVRYVVLDAEGTLAEQLQFPRRSIGGC